MKNIKLLSSSEDATSFYGVIETDAENYTITTPKNGADRITYDVEFDLVLVRTWIGSSVVNSIKIIEG